MEQHDWVPLTSAQRGLFFAHQLDPTNPCYTTAEVVELDGRIEPARLEAALLAAYDEFEQLRAEFALRVDGPVQRVRPSAGVRLEVTEVAGPAEAEETIATLLARPLDLSGGETMRAVLVRLPEVDWLVHAAHHVLLDGYGVQQLLRRVAEHVGGAPKPLSTVTLAELVAADAEVAATLRAGDVWEERLASYEGPASLAGHAAAPAPAAVRTAIDVPAAVQQALVSGAKRLGVPWADLFTTAVGAYLARMTSQPAIRIGLPLMNRIVPGVGALPAARTVCTAMNVVPITVPGQGTVAEALAATAAEQAAIRTAPFTRQEDLARRLGGRGQLFGAQVNVIPFDLELRLGEVTGVVRNLTAGPVEDVTVGLRGVPGRGRAVRLEVDANPALYPRAEVEAHLPRLVTWLGRWAAAEPETAIADLSLIDEAEHRLVTETFNATAHERDVATLGRRFADAVAAYPDAVALRCDGASRTYADLDARARLIAGGLVAAGVRAGDVVGVRLERSFALYEALHAVILLGAVYLPIDPDLPEERTAMMLADAAVTVLVDDVERFVAAGLDAGPWSGVFDDVDASAYLLFTSGSTGRPKGVLVGHRAIDNRLAWMQHELPLSVGDRVLHKTPISFDVSVWELFWPLQVGACVEIAPPGAHRDPRALARLLDGIAVAHFVPSMLRAFLGDRLARETVAASAAAGRGLRHLVTSGEALTPDLVAGAVQWLGTAPVNLYGPTEAAVDVTVWRSTPDDEVVPIGVPIWNTTCFVLDADLRPLPVGAVGELWLGGVQLAHGYVGRDDLTAERFVSTPFGRLYRTGDLAAWRFDGALRYLGRTDDQVKVRGQRVELGEIEAVVSAQPGVEGAVAGVIADRLVCWLHGDVDLAVLKTAVAATLPAAWVPTRWIPVPEIPVGTSGKADRRTLAARTPATDAGESEGGGVPPQSLVEERLAALIGQCLEVASVGRDDDFFELGGDSLAVLALLAAIEEEWGIDLELASVFAAPSPADLAVLVESALRPGAAAGTGSGFDDLLTLRPGRAGVAPLVLLPPAGGLGWCYAGLLRHLPRDLPVLTVQAPGLADGSPEPVESLTALAARQWVTIRSVVGDGAFHVAGWSLGGMAAHAVATLARAAGQQVGEVVLLDAYPSDQWQGLPEPTEADALLGLLRLGAASVPEGTVLTRDRVAQALRESGSALASLPEKVIDGCIASVLEAARLVRTPSPGVLAGSATLVVATAPRPETWVDPAGWDPLVAGDLGRFDVPCGHGELVRRAEVGEMLARLLEPWLAPCEA
ncbi:amino acid adenylation domain-containing protein [Nocardioides sp.]|uniref:amino acid adenylation domain-containing protein n=1 Tax=Nocardioides sp. TaxID=35761 RepID=UPI0026059037|nr:amino acid adenylation domain-containing protein [Nocardioides sp.]